MARYRIQHLTTYAYQYPVSISHHSARLKPLTDAGQTCESFHLATDPPSVDLIERLDYFDNAMHMFSIEETHNTLAVESNSQVYVDLSPPDLQSLQTPCGAIAQALADYARKDLVEAKQFLFHTDLTPDLPEVEAFGRRFLTEDKPLGQALQEMLDAFAEEFEFDPKATEQGTPIGQVLQQKRGVCQDYTHLMLSALRSCQLAARYVSGYILTHPPEGEERLQGADASHAWVSVFDPQSGWIDIDPTNRLVCGDQHVKVAYGRDYADVIMLGGAVTGGGAQEVKVEVTMLPVEA